jgi:hypothetical protein
MTIEQIKTAANDIIGHWNGSDDSFIDGNGEARTEDDVATAEEILDLCKELEELYKAL